MTPSERRAAQRRTAKLLKKGESPLGGKYREIVQKAVAKGTLFKSLDAAIEYAQSVGIPTFIVAHGTARDKAKYKSAPRWLALGGMTDPSFHAWNKGGYQQNERELFGEATSYRVMRNVGHAA